MDLIYAVVLIIVLIILIVVAFKLLNVLMVAPFAYATQSSLPLETNHGHTQIVFHTLRPPIVVNS